MKKHLSKAIIAFAFTALMAPAPSEARGSFPQYAELIRSQAHVLEPALIAAVIEVESNFKPHAKSSAGAMGLMQLTGSTARKFGAKNPFDPTQNVKAGTKYLRHLIDSFGRLDLALAAYNAGPGAVKKHGGIPPYNQTRKFVKKVMTRYHAYRGIEESKPTAYSSPLPAKAEKATRPAAAASRKTGSVKIAEAAVPAPDPIFIEDFSKVTFD